MGGRQCTAAVDLYSFGVVLWEIVTGERPRRGSLRSPRVPEECPQVRSESGQPAAGRQRGGSGGGCGPAGHGPQRCPSHSNRKLLHLPCVVLLRRRCQTFWRCA